ncbi:MAG TPA: MarR family transcriptional regulator, partial [Actinomycetota bacterium]|nr:MarR family transcriptional regulator [Actinomycetota bacterium]
MTNAEAHGAEDYLEAIYELAEEGERVVQARIARRLGVTRASVSEQIARLHKMKLIEVRARDISLTPHGHAVAEDAV